MKLLPVIILVFVAADCHAQQEKFQLEGMVVDSLAQPVSDVYIINYRTQEKAVSKSNGIFRINVLPGDSLFFNHISYLKKVIRVFDLLKNPVVVLQAENVNLRQVIVGPNQKTDYERARENVSFLPELKVIPFTKIKTEQEPAMQMMIQNNPVLSNEASSVSVVRFSPSEQIGKWLKKRKIRKRDNHK